MTFESDYLTKQIIAYIGNKRKLLSLIYKATQNLGIEIKPGLKFFDVFAGSGVVSRFAKSLNFEVFTNDWEYYSFIINSAYVATDKSEIAELFGSEDDFKKLLDEINSLPAPNEDEQYIAKYYAPKEDDINAVDWKTERLFYTRENALQIDKIRNWIERRWLSLSKPPEKVISTSSMTTSGDDTACTTEKVISTSSMTTPGNDTACATEKVISTSSMTTPGDDTKRKNLLLAELIYEAATHNNTSGVFKACHKEFGGHGKDALKRILGKIELHEPVLIDSDFPVHVFQKDANELVKEMPQVDIAYLDPPYNQHQYGSNYHLLNTIAKWDKIPVGFEKNTKGELKEKAGIRHDWIKTRSPYCYKNEAISSFSGLIQNLKARFILISYSTDGIIPFEEMQKICLKKGKVSIVTNEYTTYRGGKQSNERKNTNIEFILCIDTSKKSDEQDERNLDAIFLKRKSELLFKQKYSESKLKSIAESFTKESLTLGLRDCRVKPGNDTNCKPNNDAKNKPCNDTNCTTEKVISTSSMTTHGNDTACTTEKVISTSSMTTHGNDTNCKPNNDIKNKPGNDTNCTTEKVISTSSMTTPGNDIKNKHGNDTNCKPNNDINQKSSAENGDNLRASALNQPKLIIRTDDFFMLEEPENLDELSSGELKILHEKLASCVLETKEEELDEILRKIKNIHRSEFISESMKKLAHRIPCTLKKLAHKKNKEIFYKCLAEVKEAEKKIKKFYPAITEKIGEIEILAERRFNS